MRKAVCNSPQYKRFNSVDDLPEMCTSTDLCNFFGVTPGTIYNWRNGTGCNSPLPYFKCGSSIRFRKADVKIFIDQNIEGA